MMSGKLIETTAGDGAAGGTGIELDIVTIEANSGTGRLQANVTGTAGDGFGGLILEP
jgi:hypothetical protein